MDPTGLSKTVIKKTIQLVAVAIHRYRPCRSGGAGVLVEGAPQEAQQFRWKKGFVLGCLPATLEDLDLANDPATASDTIDLNGIYEPTDLKSLWSTTVFRKIVNEGEISIILAYCGKEHPTTRGKDEKLHSWVFQREEDLNTDFGMYAYSLIQLKRMPWTCNNDPTTVLTFDTNFAKWRTYSGKTIDSYGKWRAKGNMTEKKINNRYPIQHHMSVRKVSVDLMQKVKQLRASGTPLSDLPNVLGINRSPRYSTVIQEGLLCCRIGFGYQINDNILFHRLRPVLAKPDEMVIVKHAPLIITDENNPIASTVDVNGVYAPTSKTNYNTTVYAKVGDPSLVLCYCGRNIRHWLHSWILQSADDAGRAQGYGFMRVMFKRLPWKYPQGNQQKNSRKFVWEMAMNHKFETQPEMSIHLASADEIAAAKSRQNHANSQKTSDHMPLTNKAQQSTHSFSTVNLDHEMIVPSSINNHVSNKSTSSSSKTTRGRGKGTVVPTNDNSPTIEAPVTGGGSLAAPHPTTVETVANVSPQLVDSADAKAQAGKKAKKKKGSVPALTPTPTPTPIIQAIQPQSPVATTASGPPRPSDVIVYDTHHGHGVQMSQMQAVAHPSAPAFQFQPSAPAFQFQPSAPAFQLPRTLPPNWIVQIDPSSGAPFFVYTPSGHTQWNSPV